MFQVGAIVVTSIRGLLLTMSRFFIWISSPKSSSLIVLCLSQLMGTYFVSMVLLMRMNMPVQYRTIITEVLGDLQFNFYHRWFDVMFLVAALITLGILAVAHKKRSGADEQSSGYYQHHYQEQHQQHSGRSRERMMARSPHPAAGDTSFSTGM